MKDGLYKIKIHKTYEFIKMIDNKPHIVSKEKNKFKWFPTVLEENRIKKLKPVNEIDLINIIKG